MNIPRNQSSLQFLIENKIPIRQSFQLISSKSREIKISTKNLFTMNSFYELKSNYHVNLIFSKRKKYAFNLKILSVSVQKFQRCQRNN